MWYGWNTTKTSLLLSNFRLPPPFPKNLAPKHERFSELLFSFRRVLMGTALTDCFPTISNRSNVFDKFCVLSLAYRSDGFFHPLQDYVCPRDPESSSLLFATKVHYIGRISVNPNPNELGFAKTR